MDKIATLLLHIICLLLLMLPTSANAIMYPWKGDTNIEVSIINRINVPHGYVRVNVKPNSFAEWLRHLPVKEDGSPVYLYNHQKKINQNAHVAVIDIDTGRMDLQQCADAVMRLRAEYLYSKNDYASIHFNFTSGHNASFIKWAEGFRPVVQGNSVSWVKKAAADSSYGNFRKYMNSVFTYAGSYSLSKELKSVSEIQNIKIGDVFIKGGFPGHAVIVVDMATNKNTGKKIFLLAQSYMPAQDIHILMNPNDEDLSPWYDIEFGQILHTPEWIFDKKEHKRFPNN